MRRGPGLEPAWPRDTMYNAKLPINALRGAQPAAMGATTHQPSALRESGEEPLGDKTAAGGTKPSPGSLIPCPGGGGLGRPWPQRLQVFSRETWPPAGPEGTTRPWGPCPAWAGAHGGRAGLGPPQRRCRRAPAGAALRLSSPPPSPTEKRKPKKGLQEWKLTNILIHKILRLKYFCCGSLKTQRGNVIK